MFKNDADNELSYDKMCYVRNMKHPRTLEFDEFTQEQKHSLHSLCFSNMGWSHCTKNMRKTDYG